MSTTYIGPLNGTLTLTADTTDVSCQVTNFTLDASPSTTQQLPAGFCAESKAVAINGPSQWTVQFDYMQDWGDVGSLSQLMFDFDAGWVMFSFVPADPFVPQADGELQAVAGAYGGTTAETWVASKTMPIRQLEITTQT